MLGVTLMERTLIASKAVALRACFLRPSALKAIVAIRRDPAVHCGLPDLDNRWLGASIDASMDVQETLQMREFVYRTLFRLYCQRI